MPRTIFAAALAALVTLANASTSTAAPTEKDQKLLKDVTEKLLSKAKKPEGFEWPPDFGFESEGGINAFATFIRKPNDPKRYPIIRVTEGMMEKVIQGDPHRLAFILGHELGHVVKGHLIANPTRDKTPFLKATFGRDEEVEADLYGFELMLEAGYDFDKGMKAITRMHELKLDYSSFEGLGVGHPSWDNRAEKADKDKAHLWKAMASFKNGVLFLTTENYDVAIPAFEKVVEAFPKAHEAWANLGYARLMVYCDQWEKKDFEGQGIGQVMIGGFYTRLDSVKVRGKEAKLWREAVGNLRKSLELKPGQTIVLANLGLAYLLHPEGKDTKEASKFFEQAAKAAKTDSSLDPATHAALLINLGISTIADGKTEAGLAQLEEGEKLVRSFTGPSAKKLSATYDSSILFTRAMVFATKPDKADKENAFQMLEKYLTITSPFSLWWEPGYDRYAAVCKAVGKEPKAKEAFKKDRPEPVRLVTGVKVKGVEITIGTNGIDIDELGKKLGDKGLRSVAVKGTAMMRVKFEKDGIEVLTVEDNAVAVILNSPESPAIQLRGKTIAAGTVGELKVGMTTKEMEALLGEDYQPCELTASEVYYRFFREAGVAVRVSKGKVVEIVVVQIPK